MGTPEVGQGRNYSIGGDSGSSRPETVLSSLHGDLRVHREIRTGTGGGVWILLGGPRNCRGTEGVVRSWGPDLLEVTTRDRDRGLVVGILEG